jgi:hypothetical protein
LHCEEHFPDDPSIRDEEELLRRIPNRHFYLDPKTGRMRPSSAAFEDDADGQPMSVYRAEVIAAGGGDISRVLDGHIGYALCGFFVSLVRELEQSVSAQPLGTEPAHAVVCGSKTESRRRRIAKASRWIAEPEVEAK